MNENLKQVGWLAENGDMMSMAYKSSDPKSNWKPLYVDKSYSGTDHLSHNALRVKTKIDAIRKEFE